MSDIAIDGVRDGDLAEILRNFERFWGDHDVRHLHHLMFFCEFADTAFIARRDGRKATSPGTCSASLHPPATGTSMSSRSGTTPAPSAWGGGSTSGSPPPPRSAGRPR